jgi:putative transposase
MSELRKANTDFAYFITLTVAGWIDLFVREQYCEIIYTNLEFCRKNKGLEVYSYVIMSSHIHLILRQKEGKLNDWLRDFKSFTAKKLLEAIDNEHESRREWMLYMFKFYANRYKQNKDHMFWQKTSHPVELSNSWIFEQKRKYIHRNPYVAGIVTDESHYRHSSANPAMMLKVDDY